MGTTGTDEQLGRGVAALGRKGHRAVAAGAIRGGERAVAAWSADGPAPDGSTLFEIGSITKAFTGVLLADMVLRGEVALDDRLSAHLPNLRPAWRHREPTLLELATHLSGLSNTPGVMRRRELSYTLGLRRHDPWGAVGETEYQRLVAAESPRRPPGPGGTLLQPRGGASRRRTRRPRRHLLRATADGAGPSSARDGQDVRHRNGHQHRPTAPGSLTARPAPSAVEGPHARGRQPALQRRRHAVLPGRLPAAATWTPRRGPRPGPAASSQTGGANPGRALLAHPHHIRRQPVVWHNGGTWGFRSFAGFAPEQSSAAVVLSNTALSVDRIGLELTQNPGRLEGHGPIS